MTLLCIASSISVQIARPETQFALLFARHILCMPLLLLSILLSETFHVIERPCNGQIWLLLIV